MKTNSKNSKTTAVTTVIILFVFIGMLSMSFVSPVSAGGDEKKPWVVPEKAKAATSPAKADAATLAAGKTLFNKLCKSCHGAGGKGDGAKSKELETPTSDFTEAAFQKQTEGEMFYKIKEGRVDMPSFKKEMTDGERWQVVAYVRSFGAKK